MRRIYDGHLRKEFGTTEEPREWAGRITFGAAATPDVDRCYSVFQTLGERYVMIRWGRPGGIEAALCAMKQDREAARSELTAAVEALLDLTPLVDVTVAPEHERELAALTEIIVQARTHAPRDNNKILIYVPEPEGATRLAQQLVQLAKGSARLDRRVLVTSDDLAVAARVALDCVPTTRRRILAAFLDGADDIHDLGIPRRTQDYACEELGALGLLTERKAGGYALSENTRSLAEVAGCSLMLAAGSRLYSPGGVRQRLSPRTRHAV